MKAVILAGGRGSRLSEETHLRPKPMIEIGGRPMLWHIMSLYAAHGVREFIVALGYRGEMVKQYFADYAIHASDVTIELRRGEICTHRNHAEDWRVTLVDTGEATLTGGRLRRLARFLDGEDCFCMTYGDGLADIDITALIAFHRRQRRLATVTAVVPPGRFGTLVIEGERVQRFTEKPPGDNAFISGGFFVLHPAVLDRIAGDHVAWEQAPLESLAHDGELAAFRHAGFWHAMDTQRDRLHLEALWQSGRAPWQTPCATA